MSTAKRKRHHSKRELAAEFSIQVCSADGRLLSEYTLSQRRNRVTTLNAAERYVLEHLPTRGGAPLIIVISEDTQNEFRQTQSQVSFDKVPFDNKSQQSAWPDA